MTRILGTLLALLAVVPAGVGAQVPDSTMEAMDTARVDSPAVGLDPVAVPVQDTAFTPAVTPRSAMIRSFIVPGWGQAQYEAYFRGSIYFAGWAGNWFMNFRNAVRLGDARERLETRREQVEQELILGSSNPDSMRAAIEADPGILEAAVDADETASELQGLVGSREQQREDWIAWSIFWLLASGIDAYVTGHLSDFPAEVEIEPNRDRSLTVRLQVPFPARRR